jgi:hypothetical protein
MWGVRSVERCNLTGDDGSLSQAQCVTAATAGATVPFCEDFRHVQPLLSRPWDRVNGNVLGRCTRCCRVAIVCDAYGGVTLQFGGTIFLRLCVLISGRNICNICTMADPRQGAGFGGIDDETLPTTPSPSQLPTTPSHTPTPSEQRALNGFFVAGTQETPVVVGDSMDRGAKRRCESPPVGGGGPAEPSLHHQQNIVPDSLLRPEAASAAVPIDTAPHSDLPTDSAGCTFVRDEDGHLHLKCVIGRCKQELCSGLC